MSQRELQLSVFDEIVHSFFDTWPLLIPPKSEERDLDVDELSFRVSLKCRDYSVKDVLNSVIVVTLNCFQPANVIVSVGDYMNIQLVILSWVTGAVATLTCCEMREC